MLEPYDAILLISFGGPEGKDDVIPFLQNVLRGKNVPLSRMEQVAHHYYQYGGISPINGHCRELLQSLRPELDEHKISLPLYWGNRNWHPMLEDTLSQMAADGIKNALAFVTSAYSSYSSCRQYLEDIERASAIVGDTAPKVKKLRAFYNHPNFIDVNVDNVRKALDALPAELRSEAHIAFTAHSIPLGMSNNCAYEAQLLDASAMVATRVGIDNFKLVYQSRSGPPTQPWLEPDICDHLRQLHARGVKSVIVAPIGFISDHMEVIYDLDNEARTLASELGLSMTRAQTAGCDPRFIQMIRLLIEEELDTTRSKLFTGDLGVPKSDCPATCCLSGASTVGAGRPSATQGS
jgi:ferrochelatase